MKKLDFDDERKLERLRIYRKWEEEYKGDDPCLRQYCRHLAYKGGNAEAKKFPKNEQNPERVVIPE